MVINVKYLGGVIACLFLTACSVSSSIQRAEQSKSGFDGAVYEGEETIIRDDIPDSEAYRIFHQGATGFVSVQSVRNSAENRSKSFCENKGLRYELLRERVSVGAHVAGNFPRSELVFTCIAINTEQNTQNSPTAPTNRYDELRELKSLLDDGVITQEEYKQEKVKILQK
jgi:hypothetical protein